MVAQLDRDYLRVARSRSLVRLLSYATFEGRPATTRGQWVNPLVRSHLQLATAIPQRRGPSAPIFVLGVGRSGTTLLGRLLAVHPDVGFLNEPKLMWHVIDPVEDVSGFYNRTPEARMRRRARDVTFDLDTRARRLYRYYELATRSTRVVDKYCELTYRRDYLREIFPDCKLVAIVRRPEAVMGSIEQWSAAQSDGDENWWGVADRKWQVILDELVPAQPDADVLAGEAARATGDDHRALIEWIVGMRALTEPSESGALDAIVRYEDLVADPVEQMRTVLERADLRQSARIEAMIAAAVREDSRAATRGAEIPPALRPAVDDLLARLGYR